MDEKLIGPHARNLRKGRVSEPGRAYLLTTATHGRTPYLADLFIGRIVVKELRHAEESGLVQSLAWVVMPDHFHWLLILQRATLDVLMRAVKGRAARSITTRIGIAGPVFQRGYHDHALRRDEDLTSIARYVVANPLRAGLVRSVRDYPLWDAIWLP